MLALKRAPICGRNVCLSDVYVFYDINKLELNWPHAKLNITDIFNIECCNIFGSKCIVCKKTANLTRVSSMARIQVCVDRELFVPPNARCCKRHLKDNFVTKEATNAIEVKSDYSTFSDGTLCELLGIMRSVTARKGLDFDHLPTLINDDYYNLRGLKNNQFDSIVTYIKGNIKTTCRSFRTCLVLLLTKLWTSL